jgi:hypothetical protein
MADASRPSLALLYPAPGLPAVVHAGDSLYVRLRTPAALTPPPGTQQANVLERYRAELRGSAIHLGVDASERHRHVLPVMSIRPDGGESLVYRMRVDVPAYVAPGTYAITLRSPFGARSAEQAVRVLPRGAVPRIARLPPGMLAPPAAAGAQPVDVWLAGAAAEEEAREGARDASGLKAEAREGARAASGLNAEAREGARAASGSNAKAREGALDASDAETRARRRARGLPTARLAGASKLATSNAGAAPPAVALNAPKPPRSPERGAGVATASNRGPVLAGAAEVPSAREAPALAAELTSDPAPTLLAHGSAVALRVNDALWVRAGCAHADAFAREVDAVAAIEKRHRVPFDPNRAPAPPSAAALAAAPRLTSRDDRLEVAWPAADGFGAARHDTAEAGTPLELSVLLPFAARATADSGSLAFYPAAEPTARTPTAKLARWTIPQGAHATLTLSAPRSEPPLEFRPQTVRSGQPAHLRIVGVGDNARVAFALGVSRTAYASSELPVTFAGPLSHPVRAQVFEADGAGRVIQGHLWVEPHRPPNCTIARAGRAPVPDWLAPLCLALAMLKRRGRTRPWNRLPPQLRF